MIQIYEAAKQLHEFLMKHQIPYAIIGGIAVQRWGKPRLTSDLDLSIGAPIAKGRRASILRLRRRPSEREIRQY